MENPIIVQQTTSGRVYQLVRDGGKLLCYHVGGELRGVDPDRLVGSTGPYRPTEKKDICIFAEDIVSVKYSHMAASTSGYDMVAKVKTSAKTYRFAPWLGTENEALQSFLEGICPDPDSTWTEKPSASETVTAEPSHKKLFKAYAIGLWIYIAAVFIPWFFFSVPYKLFAVLALLPLPVSLILYFCFPNELTMSERQKKQDGRVNIERQLLFAGVLPALRALLDFNFLSWSRWLIISAVVFGIGVAAFLLLSKEWRREKVLLVGCILMFLFYSPGLTAELNYIFDYAEPTQQTAIVQDMDISTSSKGPDSYYLTVCQPNGKTQKLEVGKEFYGQTEIGDEVTVETCSGAFGIPYAFVR